MVMDFQQTTGNAAESASHKLIVNMYLDNLQVQQSDDYFKQKEKENQ